MRIAPCTAAILVATLLSTGCTWSRAQVNTEDFVLKARKVEPGRTTVQDLPQLFGSQPFSWFETPDGKVVYTYAYGDSKTEGLVLVVFNFLKTNTAIDTAFFVASGKEPDAVVLEKYVGTNVESVPWEWWPFGG